LKEQHLYGSSRLGIRERVGVTTGTGEAVFDPGAIAYLRGEKRYELSNHLGNVLVTISDRKYGVDTSGDGESDRFIADVLSAQDYYPFGMQMPGRAFAAGTGYRYGFNGKEDDPDLADGLIAFEARAYDSRISRFFSNDPRSEEYPWQSPYAYYSNSPTGVIDFNGEGDYYKKDGTHLGNDGKNDNKLYTAERMRVVISEKKDANGNAIMLGGKRVVEQIKVFEGAIKLNMSHSDFQEAVSIVRQEGDSKDPAEYKVLASIFFNHAGNDPTKLVQTIRKESSVYRVGKPKDRFSPEDNSIPVISSRAGILNRLIGGPDLSGGATQNDGNDFFAWGLTRGKWHNGKHAKFTEYQTITISKDIFDKAVSNLRAAHPKGTVKFSAFGLGTMPIIESVFLDWRNFDKNGNFIYQTGVKNGRHLEATATAGETIYWRVNIKR
ncbi:RHS repeat-associated core domain-containing protein, partial [Flaviaesturariibacter flavus]|uniref:RHS repeat-associated core domain-containing protein n=1 Tax=Flaviaesturariibacter flavus TaxID=2502780 RepID=UPI0029394E8D